MGWLSSVVSSVGNAIEDAADAVGGAIEDAGKAVVDGVKAAGEGLMDGAIGKMMADALAAMGMPDEICTIFKMMGDPMHATEDLGELIDKVGKDLGLPEQLTGALKRVLKKAEQYAKDFAEGGFGNMVAHMGRDLGLPDEICEALAAAIDAYTGNEAGAAAHLMKLGADIAKRLGVPDSVTHVVAFAADAYRGDVKGALKEGAEVGLAVVDKLDIAPELKDLAHLGVHAIEGDSKAMQADALNLATDAASRLGLPPEAMAALKFAVAYQTGDKEAMKEAGRDLGHDLVNRLPPEARALLNKAVDLAANDPEGALKLIESLPAEGKEAFHLLTNAVKDPELLKQAANLGADLLPESVRGPFKQAVELYAKDPEAALRLIKNLPREAQAEFTALLAKAKDPAALAQLADAGIDLLPENLRGPLHQALDLYAKDPAAAMRLIQDLPAQAQAQFKNLLEKAADPATPERLANAGINLLPENIRGPLKQAVDLYATDPKAALEFVKSLPAEAQAKFTELLAKATDPAVLRDAGKAAADQVFARLSPEAQRAFQIGVHLGSDNAQALKDDVASYSEDEIAKLPPQAKKTLRIVGEIADGNSEALKAEIDQAKDRAAQAFRDQILIPVRA
jgi:hypothetical protein